LCTVLVESASHGLASFGSITSALIVDIQDGAVSGGPVFFHVRGSA
jgi:hypothetical protein